MRNDCVSFDFPDHLPPLNALRDIVRGRTLHHRRPHLLPSVVFLSRLCLLSSKITDGAAEEREIHLLEPARDAAGALPPSRRSPARAGRCRRAGRPPPPVSEVAWATCHSILT